MLDDPLGHLLDLYLGIVLAGYEQIGDLVPDRGLVLEIDERVPNRLQLAGTNLLVKPLGEAL